MYCRLIDRFRGAFIGSAIAEAASSESSLTASLLHESQRLFSLSIFSEAFVQEPHSDPQSNLPIDSQTVAQTVLMTLMLHDSELDRRQALQKSQAGLGLWLLSQSLVLRLNHQKVTFETLQLINCKHSNIPPPDSHGVLATLEGLIIQRTPLQETTQAIATYPGMSELDQAIALALYSWICTPQHFNIGVKRSHQALKYWPDNNRHLIPAITGLIAGVSVGIDTLPSPLPPSLETLTHTLIPTADRLFQIWSGANPTHPELSRLQHAVITPMKTLKPRNSEHLTLNSDYD